MCAAPHRSGSGHDTHQSDHGAVLFRRPRPLLCASESGRSCKEEDERTQESPPRHLTRSHSSSALRCRLSDGTERSCFEQELAGGGGAAAAENSAHMACWTWSRTSASIVASLSAMRCARSAHNAPAAKGSEKGGKFGAWDYGATLEEEAERCGLVKHKRNAHSDTHAHTGLAGVRGTWLKHLENKQTCCRVARRAPGCHREGSVSVC
jgi:hypothetical protein